MEEGTEDQPKQVNSKWKDVLYKGDHFGLAEGRLVLPRDTMDL